MQGRTLRLRTAELPPCEGYQACDESGKFFAASATPL